MRSYLKPKMNAAREAQVSFSRQLSAYLISQVVMSGRNLVYSPLCIHNLLSLLASGATGNTREQLIGTLRVVSPITMGANFLLLDDYNLGGPYINHAGGLWVYGSHGTNLKQFIINLANERYHMVAHSIYTNYNTPEDCRNIMNKWIEDETGGKNLFPPGSITAETRLVLGNAIRFKGKFTENFERSAPNTFRLPGGHIVSTPFMGSKKARFISVYDHFKVLKLPYQEGIDGRKFSLYIFLPDADDGVQSLSAKMRAQSDFFNVYIPRVRVPVGELRIPKFRMAMALELAELFPSLRLDLPFKMTGDFSQMLDSPNASNYYVSTMQHACSLEVSEEGAEAAAASEAELQIPPIDFVADHPFVFMIRDDTSGVVFILGNLLNPLS